MWVSRHVGLRGSNREFSMAMIPTALYPSLLYISIHVYTSFMWSPASGQVDTIYSRYGTRRSPPSPPLRLPSDPHPQHFSRTPHKALSLLVCCPSSTSRATSGRRLRDNLAHTARIGQEYRKRTREQYFIRRRQLQNLGNYGALTRRRDRGEDLIDRAPSAP